MAIFKLKKLLRISKIIFINYTIKTLVNLPSLFFLLNLCLYLGYSNADNWISESWRNFLVKIGHETIKLFIELISGDPLYLHGKIIKSNLLFIEKFDLVLLCLSFTAQKDYEEQDKHNIDYNYVEEEIITTCWKGVDIIIVVIALINVRNQFRSLRSIKS